MRSLILSAALLVASAAAASAEEVSQAVREACRSDYQAYCSAHEVGSDALRDCMTDAFDKLSPACVSAILDAEAAHDAAEAAREPAPPAATSQVEKSAKAKSSAKAARTAKLRRESRRVRHAERRRPRTRVAVHIDRGRLAVRRALSVAARHVRRVLH